MLPRPSAIVAESSSSAATLAAPHVSLVTVNVAGLSQSDYRRNAVRNIMSILEIVLRVQPQVILMQEVTAEMLGTARILLHNEGWRLCHDCDYEHE